MGAGRFHSAKQRNTSKGSSSYTTNGDPVMGGMSHSLCQRPQLLDSPALDSVPPAAFCCSARGCYFFKFPSWLVQTACAPNHPNAQAFSLWQKMSDQKDSATNVSVSNHVEHKTSMEPKPKQAQIKQDFY